MRDWRKDRSASRFRFWFAAAGKNRPHTSRIDPSGGIMHRQVTDELSGQDEESNAFDPMDKGG